MSSIADRRAAKVAAARMLIGTRTIERRFTRELAGIMAGVHETVLDYLGPSLRGMTTDARHKPINPPSGVAGKDLDAVMRAILPQIPPKVSAAHSKMSKSLEKNYAATMSKIVPVKLQALGSNVAMEAAQARNESIQLVENAARVYADQVREVFGDPEVTLGVRWEVLRDRLLERGDVSKARAELIARDQTLKLNGAINRAQQTGVGIQSYTWSTSGDERVRETHAALNGQQFMWAAPPPPGHPGEDFQCRCVAVPVIDLE